MEIKSLSDEDLFKTYVLILKDMKERKLIRTYNSPVSGHAENIAAKELELKLERPSHKGFDGKDRQGIRYQIKGRRITPTNKSRKLGVIRNYKKHEFDFLVAVIFDEFFKVSEMWKFPWDVVGKYLKPDKHQHGNILHCKGAILKDPKVIRLK